MDEKKNVDACKVDTLTPPLSVALCFIMVLHRRVWMSGHRQNVTTCDVELLFLTIRVYKTLRPYLGFGGWSRCQSHAGSEGAVDPLEFLQAARPSRNTVTTICEEWSWVIFHVDPSPVSRRLSCLCCMVDGQLGRRQGSSVKVYITLILGWIDM
jgi:hypothetical protein